MARKAKIEIQNTDGAGNQTEVAKKITPAQAVKAMGATGAKGPRSVFAGGRGRRPRAVKANRAAPRSCFSGSRGGSRGGPQDGSGPRGGTALCPQS